MLAPSTSDDTLRQSIELNNELLKQSREAIAIAQSAVNRVDYLETQVTELRGIIAGLLRALDDKDAAALLWEIRPKALAAIAAKKKSRLARAEIEQKVFLALLDEIYANTPKKARAKRIAANLGISPQYVLRVIKRLRNCTYPNDF